MTTLSIVEDFDVIEDGVGQFEPRLPLLSIEQLVLHARPERLHHGVVERVTDRPERGHETGVSDSLGEGPGGELNSVISVNDGTLLHSSLFNGHVERVDDERLVLSRVNGPTHNAATARIDHSTAVDLA